MEKHTNELFPSVTRSYHGNLPLLPDDAAHSPGARHPKVLTYTGARFRATTSFSLR